MGSLTLTAYFSSTQGIAYADDSGIIAYVVDYKIYIEKAAGADIRVYSIDGRPIASLSNAKEYVTIPVPSAGIYIVKVGNYPARKVVVIR